MHATSIAKQLAYVKFATIFVMTNSFISRPGIDLHGFLGIIRKAMLINTLKSVDPKYWVSRFNLKTGYDAAVKCNPGRKEPKPTLV